MTQKAHPSFLTAVREQLVTLMDVDEVIAAGDPGLSRWVDDDGVTHVSVYDQVTGDRMTGIVAGDLMVDWQ